MQILILSTVSRLSGFLNTTLDKDLKSTHPLSSVYQVSCGSGKPSAEAIMDFNGSVHDSKAITPCPSQIPYPLPCAHVRLECGIESTR